MSFTQLVYQIVFATKGRRKTLIKSGRFRLFQYIRGILRKKQCFVYAIGGVEDHIHIVCAIHPTISLAGLVRDIKVASHKYIDQEQLFPDFDAFQLGYGAFTYSREAIPNLKLYLARQELKHQTITLEEELTYILDKHGLKFDEDMLR